MAHPIGSFDGAVLDRTAGSNELNLHVVFLVPPLQFFGSELKAVVDPTELRLAAPGNNAFQYPHNAFGGQGHIAFNGQGVPCTVVYDVKGSKFAYSHYSIIITSMFQLKLILFAT